MTILRPQIGNNCGTGSLLLRVCGRNQRSFESYGGHRSFGTDLDGDVPTTSALTRSLKNSVKQQSAACNVTCLVGGISRVEQTLTYGVFGIAAFMFWGGLVHLTAENDASEGLFQLTLNEPIQISVVVLDRCDVILDRECVIIFDDQIEVAVPWSDARAQKMPEGETSAKPGNAPIRPLARDPSVMPAAVAKVGAVDP